MPRRSGAWRQVANQCVTILYKFKIHAASEATGGRRDGRGELNKTLQNGKVRGYLPYFFSSEAKKRPTAYYAWIGGLWQRTLKPPTVSGPSYGGYSAAKLQIKHANQQSGNSPIRVHIVTSQRLTPSSLEAQG